MKQIKLTTIALSVFFILIGITSFSQVQIPISGTYKVVTETYYDQLEVKGQQINVLKQGKVVGTFIAIEEKDEQYIFEIVKPGVETVDSNPNRDRKLIKVKINTLTEDECTFTSTHPNGTIEQITLKK